MRRWVKREVLIRACLKLSSFIYKLVNSNMVHSLSHRSKHRKMLLINVCDAEDAPTSGMMLLILTSRKCQCWHFAEWFVDLTVWKCSKVLSWRFCVGSVAQDSMLGQHFRSDWNILNMTWGMPWHCISTFMVPCWYAALTLVTPRLCL